ncbi:MAG: glycerol-3-phosphate 1-O-acyltransferase PlsY [Mycoplasmataceae bacterium]|nr:glycerol-3-phosphate 1-O-acyltransferase PlsY [Mycoplasmataceae bacterium]
MTPLWISLVAISFAIIGYLFGNVLFGSLISKLYKKNIREVGSQNVGATNVSRAMGKPMGLLVAVLDTLKAYLAVIVCWVIYRYSIFQWEPTNYEIFSLVYISGVFAVIGHCFPIIYIVKLFKTKFNFAESKSKSGGKGVATTGGVILAISPWIGLIGFGLWVLLIAITRYVSIASMVTMFVCAFLIFVPHLDFIYLFQHSLLFPNVNATEYPLILGKCILMLVMLCNSFIIIARHSQNIARLMKHEEKRFF